MPGNSAPADVLADLWARAGLPAEALAQARLTGADPVFPSSFPVGTAAQTLLIALGGISTSIAFSANLVAALAINFVARKFLIFKE
jgi:hypothetical protein